MAGMTGSFLRDSTQSRLARFRKFLCCFTICIYRTSTSWSTHSPSLMMLMFAASARGLWEARAKSSNSATASSFNFSGGEWLKVSAILLLEPLSITNFYPGSVINQTSCFHAIQDRRTQVGMAEPAIHGILIPKFRGS